MTKKMANHLHQYMRVTLGKDYVVFRCMKPGCTHYIDIKLAPNRLCECNRCGEPMVLGKYAMSLVRPHCDNCIEKKDSADINKLGELFT